MMPAFSDIGPLKEYLVFVSILAISIFAAARSERVNRWVEQTNLTVAAWARKRNAFPDVDVVHELRRIDIARIALGTIAMARYGDVLISAIANGSQNTIILSAIAVTFSLMITIGFLTPIAMLILMSTANVLIDNAIGASTLGTMVLSIALLSLIVAPAGRTLSLDAYLFRREKIGASVINAMYRLFGSVSSDRIIIGKLAGVLAYYCLCLYSVSWHIHDPAWVSGNVLNWVMLSPSSNPLYSDLAWQVYQWSPYFFVNFFRLSILGMIVWYLLFLPGLFAGWYVRTAIILWGLAFFLISTFILPLSYLGPYELVFWFFLYLHIPAFSASPKRSLIVLFDDRCNLCDRTVKILSWLDVFGVLTFLPIRRNIETAARFNVTLEEGLTDLVGIEEATGRRFGGYALYEALATRLFFLWPAWPFLWLGRHLRVGPAVYRFIADRRTKLFGVCEFSTIPDRFTRFSSISDLNSRDASATYSAATKGILLTLIFMVIVFSFRLPTFSLEVDKLAPGRWVTAVFGSSPLAFGIGKINVFNESDLSLFTIKSSGELVPKVGTETSNDAFENGQSITGAVFEMSDQQRYSIIKFSRVMSRKNLGCDLPFWEQTAKLYVDALSSDARSVPDSDLKVTVHKVRWPTKEDFRAYRPVSPEVNILCQARIDAKTGELLDLTFDQAGVDAALKAKGYPPYIRADAALVALNYQCRADAAWLNVMMKYDTSLSTRPGLLQAAQDLYQDHYGKFEIDCLFRVVKIMQANHDLDESARVKNVPELCDVGVTLSKAFAEAAKPDEKFHVRMEQLSIAAQDAQAAGDHLQCVKSAASSRRSYFERIMKPESYDDWENPGSTPPDIVVGITHDAY